MRNNDAMRTAVGEADFKAQTTPVIVDVISQKGSNLHVENRELFDRLVFGSYVAVLQSPRGGPQCE